MVDHTFFHCSPVMLGTQSVIRAGNWGRIINLYGYKHNFFYRENVFDSSRAQFAASAPSRMASVFAFRTAQEAKDYRLRENKHMELIYEVEPVNQGCSLFYGWLNFFEDKTLSEPQRADLYWQNGQAAVYGTTTFSPAVSVAPVSYEVLIGSDVRVLQQVV